MFGSAWAGVEVEGTTPTTAARASPDSAAPNGRAMVRFRPFSTSGRSPLRVVRLPGELTGSGTTGPTPAPRWHQVPPPCGRFTPDGLVPRLPGLRAGPRLDAVSAWIRSDPLARTPERHTLVGLTGPHQTFIPKFRGVSCHAYGQSGGFVTRVTPATPVTAVRSRRLDLDRVDGLDEPERGHEPALGEDVERTALVVVEGQLGRGPEQHGHHAVVARQPAHHAAVAVDSRRHVPGRCQRPPTVRAAAGPRRRVAAYSRSARLS